MAKDTHKGQKTQKVWAGGKSKGKSNKTRKRGREGKKPEARWKETGCRNAWDPTYLNRGKCTSK